MKDAAAAVAAPIWRIMRGQDNLGLLLAVTMVLSAGAAIVTARMAISEARAELTRVRFDTWVETVDMLERSGWGPLPIGDTIPVRYFRGIGDPYNMMMDSSYIMEADSYYWHCDGTKDGASDGYMGIGCSGEWTLRERDQ